MVRFQALCLGIPHLRYARKSLCFTCVLGNLASVNVLHDDMPQQRLRHA